MNTQIILLKIYLLDIISKKHKIILHNGEDFYKNLNYSLNMLY